MQVIVSLKVVPDDQDISIKPDRTLNYSIARPKISDYDTNAIEAAVQFATANDASVCGMSVGSSFVDESKIKKGILSRGLECLYMLADDVYDMADAHVTAKALADCVEKIGNWDLIVCGDGSADNYAHQVNAQLAELLGVATISGVISMRLEGERLVCERLLESEKDTVAVSLPAVVSVAPEAAVPRIPSMKDILGAGKKPVVLWGAADATLAAATLEVSEILAPEPTPRACNVIEDLDQFVDAFKQAVA